MKGLIVARGMRGEIGVNGELPWGRGLPSDLKKFRETTIENAVIMGKNTYLSIGKPLVNRLNIVVSATMPETDGVVVVSSLEKAYDAVPVSIHSFVIGGARLYREAVDMVDVAYVTSVEATFSDTDVFFDYQFNSPEWSHQHTNGARTERDEYSFGFDVYTRNQS